MKKSIIITALLILLSAAAAFAQTPDFTGNWELDIKKSKTPSPGRITSSSWKMKVNQTEKELKVESDIKSERGDRIGTDTYNLEGKETKSENGSNQWQGTATLKVLDKNNKLVLSSSRKVSLQAGEFISTTVETWELIEDGKAIRVLREINVPDNAPVKSMKLELYFAKK